MSMKYAVKMNCKDFFTDLIWKVKRKVHNEYVLPVMVYGSETWALKKAHMELLSVAQLKMERIMLDIILRDHTRNTR